MSDAPLISLLTQAQLQGIRSGASSSSATAVPPAIARLPTGTVLSGRVMGRDSNGNPVLRTEMGDLPLHTHFKLRSGNEVVIRLESSTAGLRARMLSIDGQSPKLAAQHTASQGDTVKTSLELPGSASQTSQSNTAQAKGDALHLSLPRETVFRAILLTRSENLPEVIRQLPPSVQVSPQRLSSGAQVNFRILASDIPLPSTSATLPPSTGGTQPSAPSLAQTPATGTSTPTATPPTGSQTPTPSAPSAPQPPTVLSPASAQTSAPPSPQPQQAGANATNMLAPGTSTPQLPAITAAAAPSAATTSLPPASLGEGVPPAASASSGQQPTANTAGGAATSAHPPLPPSTAAASPLPPTTNTAPVPPGAPAQPATTSDASSSHLQPATPPQDSYKVFTIARPYVPSNPYAAYSKSTGLQGAAAPSTPGASLPASPASTAASQLLPPAGQQTSAGNIASGQFPAQVVGTEKSGDLVLTTPLGTLKFPASTLPTDSKIPPGTRLLLELVSLRPTSGTSSAAATESRSQLLPAVSTLPALSTSWPALEELIVTLHQFDPAASAQFVQNSLPKIGGQMTTGMLFFLAALRGGDLQQWLGNRAVDTLERNQRGDLLRSLGADFQLLRNAFLESPSPNWQAVFFPIVHDEELHQARLFIKKDEKRSGDTPDHKKGLRFIVEVELSELGEMQLDGFVKKKEKNTLFDLIVRTLKPMAEHYRRDILRIFNDAAEITGFKGHLQFSNDERFPITPLEEVLDHHNDVVA